MTSVSQISEQTEGFGHPAFRSDMDTNVSSATPVQVAQELRSVDRAMGWLVVNRWTYRVIRFAGRLITPAFDNTEVVVADASQIAPKAKIVTPEQITGTGALFLIHGGGMVIGRPQDVLMTAADLARSAGIPVICPNYRLAPEACAPAAINDIHAAWLALQASAQDMDIDPSKVAIGGLSAGGGLAAVLAQRLRDEGGTQPAAQMLVYPMLDDRTASRRELDKPRHRVWSNSNNLFGWTSYLGEAPGKTAPTYAVAARHDDLTGLPPTWLGVGTCDLFLDENRAYVHRLKEAQIDVTYVEVAGAIHGFDIAQTGMSKAFCAAQTQFLIRFTS